MTIDRNIDSQIDKNIDRQIGKNIDIHRWIEIFINRYIKRQMDRNMDIRINGKNKALLLNKGIRHIDKRPKEQKA